MVKKKTKQKGGASKSKAGQPTMSAADRRDLRQADQLEAKAAPGAKGSPKMRAQAAALRRGVHGRVVEREETRAVQASIAQRIALEEARGGDGSVLHDGKTVRIAGHDGLKNLASTGALTEGQALAGRAYRQCWEAAGRGLRTAKYGDAPGSRAGSGDLAALQSAYLAARMAQFERAIGDVITVQIVRLVAGEGRTIASLGGTRWGRGQATKALCAGLDAIAAVLPVKPSVRPLAESAN